MSAVKKIIIKNYPSFHIFEKSKEYNPLIWDFLTGQKKKEKIDALKARKYHIWFTEGSKSCQSIDSAVLYDELMMQFLLSTYSSIFAEEAYAICNTLHHLLFKPHFLLSIFIDSLSTIKAIEADYTAQFIIQKKFIVFYIN